MLLCGVTLELRLYWYIDDKDKEVAMAELFQKVVPYEFNYLCEACGNGMMKANGEQEGEGFVHGCMICSATATLSKPYPHVEYFPEGQQPEAK